MFVNYYYCYYVNLWYINNTINPSPSFGQWIVNLDCMLVLDHPGLHRETVHISECSLGSGVDILSEVRKRPHTTDAATIVLDHLLLVRGTPIRTMVFDGSLSIYLYVYLSIIIGPFIVYFFILLVLVCLFALRTL